MNFYIHKLDPIAFRIFDLPFPWYWLVYFFGYFFIIYRYNFLRKKFLTDISVQDFSDFAFLGFLVMLMGGKFFYILFYNFTYYASNWSRVFRIYEGGMSFHGALLSLGVFTYFFAKKRNLDFWKIGDIVTLNIGLVLFFGRIANFVNGELAGRVSNVAWAVIFPRYQDMMPRHPSQLYEAVLEGLLIFILLNRHQDDLKNDPGKTSIKFLAYYGFARFICEFFREPDHQIGMLSIFTIGQFYCLLMIIISIFMFVKKSNPRGDKKDNS